MKKCKKCANYETVDCFFFGEAKPKKLLRKEKISREQDDCWVDEEDKWQLEDTINENTITGD